MEELENTYDDGIIEEFPEYSPKSDFSKAEIVKIVVQRCCEVRANEMKSGYWNMSVSKIGTPIKEWHADTRKQFISAVDSLRSLLNPEVRRDERFKKIEKQIMEKCKEIWNKYAYADIRVTQSVDNNNVQSGVSYKKTGNKYMPDIGASVVMITGLNRFKVSQGGWDNYVNAYWDNLLSLYDNIFASLNDLIDRNNYFKQKLHYA